MSIGRMPSQASVNASPRRVVRRPGGVDLRRPRRCRRREAELGAPGDVGLEVGAQAVDRVLAWCRRARSAARSWRARSAARVLLAPSTLGASRPVIGQRRPGPEPLDGRAGADELDARRDAGLGAQPLVRVVHVGRRAGVQPGDDDVALVVVQAGEQPAQRHQGVGHQPAPHAGVHGVGQRAHPDVDADEAAQAGGQGRARRCPSCRCRRSR